MLWSFNTCDWRLNVRISPNDSLWVLLSVHDHSPGKDSQRICLIEHRLSVSHYRAVVLYVEFCCHSGNVINLPGGFHRALCFATSKSLFQTSNSEDIATR